MTRRTIVRFMFRTLDRCKRNDDASAKAMHVEGFGAKTEMGFFETWRVFDKYHSFWKKLGFWMKLPNFGHY